MVKPCKLGNNIRYSFSKIDEKLEKLGQDWGSELIYNKINDVADKKKGA